MPAVFSAWNEQSLTHDTVLFDNAPLKKSLACFVDVLPLDLNIWRVPGNLGCAGHLAPAYALAYLYEYIVFADDDFVPGPSALWKLVGEADALKKEGFATLGYYGRKFVTDHGRGRDHTYGYRYGNAPPGKVDLTIRGHLVQAQNLHHVLAFRQKMVTAAPADGRRLTSIHDDMLLCLGIQAMTSRPSYVLKMEGEQRLIARDLDQSGAVYKRPEHLEERNEFIDLAEWCGWKSLAERSLT